MGVGIALLAANALAGGWGAVAWLRKDASRAFWYFLRVAQATVAIQVAIGFFLVARGSSAPDGLHIAYGVAPLVITLVTEGMRFGAAQRELDAIEDLEALDTSAQVALAKRVAIAEMGVMTVGVLMILTLVLRAYQTGG